MTRILFLLAAATIGTIGLGGFAAAQTQVSTSRTYVCPKCGKVHIRSTKQASTSDRGQTQTVSAEIPMAPTSRLRATSGVINVLAALNAQRKRSGVPVLRFDAQLQVVAQRRATLMASRGLKNHPPGSFSPGRYEGVGWSSSYSPSGVSACFTRDSRMRYAGAAMATGRDGVYFAVVYR